MGRISSYRDLVVWQKGMDIVEAVYRLTLGFPKSELYGLTAQMRRAAVSVPSNIAEGNTRTGTKEYLHHLSTAQASLAELETQLEIARRLNFAGSEEVSPIAEHAAVLGRQLYALRNSLLKKL